jgi:4-carboxymuconolactone decarboxylase
MKCLKTIKENENSPCMKKIKSIVILFAILIAYTNAMNAQKTELIFLKGDVITNNNFTGTAWLHMLVNNDSIYNTSIGNVTFEPKARTNWHKHPGGQILLARNYIKEML